MVALTSVLTLLLPLVASAAPAAAPEANAARLSEEKPWQLSQITVFKANKGSAAPSYIDFVFNDVNKGLELKTKCSHFILPGSSETITSGQAGKCDNSTVGFSFNGRQLKLQRTYRDDSVGQPPYNYVTAFGSGNTTFTSKKSSCGTTQTMKKLDVPITALIA